MGKQNAVFYDILKPFHVCTLLLSKLATVKNELLLKECSCLQVQYLNLKDLSYSKASSKKFKTSKTQIFRLEIQKHRN